MEYGTKSQFESLSWLLLNRLMWVGVLGTAWTVLKPGGWLFRSIDFIARNQPNSFYYVTAGVLGLLAAKVWLDNIEPRAIHNLLTVTWAFAGTLFILSLMLPL